MKQALEVAGRYLRAPEGAARTFWVAIGAAVLSICIVFSFALLFRIALLTACLWAPACLLQFLNLSSLRSRLERTLVRTAELDKLTEKRFEGNSITAAVIPEGIGKRFYSDAVFLSISAILFIAAVFILALRAVSGALDEVFWGPWPVNWRISLALAIALTGGLFFCIQRWWQPHRRLRPGLEESIQFTLVPLNDAIASAMARQEAISAEIQVWEQRLGIAHLRGSIENALAVLKTELPHAFERAQGIYTELQKAVDAEETRKRELQLAFQAYRCACESIDAAASLFPAIPSVLNRELQSCRATLDRADVKSLLLTGNWPQYRLIAGIVQARAQIVPEVAAAMIRPPNAATPAYTECETDLEKALRILRLPPKASPDETHRAYRWLSAMWHPDRRLAPDDTEIKSINWAYAYLRAAEFNSRKM